MKEAIKEADRILGNKKKYRRAMLALVLVLLTIAYGFYCGEISRIIMAFFGGK
jgi:hypothetical protein